MHDMWANVQVGKDSGVTLKAADSAQQPGNRADAQTTKVNVRLMQALQASHEPDKMMCRPLQQDEICIYITYKTIILYCYIYHLIKIEHIIYIYIFNL